LSITDITFQDFIHFWARLALLFVIVEAYLTVNKIWIRKHEAVVAESVSVSAQLLALATGVPFVALYINEGAFEGAVSEGIMLLVNLAMIAIGIGIWVEGRRELGFWGKLKKSLRVERREVGALLGDVLHPVGASDVLQMLIDMALIDGEFDDREREFIKVLARKWNIDFDSLMTGLEKNPGLQHSFSELREILEQYLTKSPPAEQVSQLGDVLAMLVSIDDSVSPEEQMMMDELGGMISRYTTGADAAVHHVFIAPQSPAQEAALKQIMPGLQKQLRLGGEVLGVGSYYSWAYAEMVRDRYRDAGYLTVAEKSA
jgi:hypothetical protein